MNTTTAVRITVNGQPLDVPDGTVLDLVARHTGRALNQDGTPADGSRLGVAVALNQEVVPRSAWAATGLAAGDNVELLSAVQGG